MTKGDIQSIVPNQARWLIEVGVEDVEQKLGYSLDSRIDSVKIVDKTVEESIEQDYAEVKFWDPDAKILQVFQEQTRERWEVKPTEREGIINPIWGIKLGYANQDPSRYAARTGPVKIERLQGTSNGGIASQFKIYSFLLDMRHNMTTGKSSTPIGVGTPAFTIEEDTNPVKDVIRDIADAYNLDVNFGDPKAEDAIERVGIKEGLRIEDFKKRTDESDLQYLIHIRNVLNQWENKQLVSGKDIAEVFFGVKTAKELYEETEKEARETYLRNLSSLMNDYIIKDLGDTLYFGKRRDFNKARLSHQIPVYQYLHGNRALLDWKISVRKIEKEKNFLQTLLSSFSGKTTNRAAFAEMKENQVLLGALLTSKDFKDIEKWSTKEGQAEFWKIKRKVWKRLTDVSPEPRRGKYELANLFAKIMADAEIEGTVVGSPWLRADNFIGIDVNSPAIKDKPFKYTRLFLLEEVEHNLDSSGLMTTKFKGKGFTVDRSDELIRKLKIAKEAKLTPGGWSLTNLLGGFV